MVRNEIMQPYPRRQESTWQRIPYPKCQYCQSGYKTIPCHSCVGTGVQHCPKQKLPWPAFGQLCKTCNGTKVVRIPCSNCGARGYIIPR